MNPSLEDPPVPDQPVPPLPSVSVAHPPVRVLLAGYGGAGRVFHAPLLTSTPGIHLVGVVSSRRAEVAQRLPGVPCWPDLAQALAHSQPDWVVVATPNATHHDLACQALQAGAHVVVDKPCTPALQETQALLALAQRQRRALTVFQNRRWDADFLALRQVLASGVLGRVVQVESRFDRYRPQVPVRWREQPGPGSGLWMDLGPHLVDQALQLFGPPRAVRLDALAQRDAAVVDDWFSAMLDCGEHGARVRLSASTLAAQPAPRWVVHGTRGSYVQWGLDPQEEALKSGQTPTSEGTPWGSGMQPGELVYFKTMAGVAEPVTVRTPGPRAWGNYPAFYAQLRDWTWGLQDQLPVTASDVEAVMRVLERGALSARSGCWQPLNP